MSDGSELGDRTPRSGTDGPARLRRARVGGVAAVLAVVAAVVVVAAAVGEPSDRGDAFGAGLPMTALVLGLDALTGAFVVSALLLVLLVVWALAGGRTAGRRRWPRERSLLGVVAVLAVSLLLIWQIQRGGLGEGFAAMFEELDIAGELEIVILDPQEESPIASGVRRIATIAGGLVLLAAAALWWRWLNHEPDEGDDTPSDEATGLLREAVSAALVDAEDESDPRKAILRCYAHLERALTEAGCPRAPTETAREHRHRAAGTLGPAAQAAARLVDRFERARYDSAPLGEADRRTAISALHDVRRGLGDHAVRPDAEPGREQGRRQ